MNEQKQQKYTEVVMTVKEKCRVCYTCVRECPAKAIRIYDGQACILPERCIGCGNCVRVCSQNAKQIINTTDEVRKILKGDIPCAIMVAPSFPAEFGGMDYRYFVGLLKKLGFNYVNEVAFGADLIALEYENKLKNTNGQFIATTCPAVVQYVSKYAPDLVKSLIPVVSPMVATARVLKKLHGDNLKIVFAGPCTAKKCEGADDEIKDDIAAVLTFKELRVMIDEIKLNQKEAILSDFDEPIGGLGALFALSGGILQAAGMKEDLMKDEIVTAEGKDFVDAIREFEQGFFKTRLLEVLACPGCIMGAGMSVNDAFFKRRSRVSSYVRKKMDTHNLMKWKENLQLFGNIKLDRKFRKEDQRLKQPDMKVIKMIMKKMGKEEEKDELNCGACGYDTCREHALAIYKGLAENEMCLPYTIDKLNKTIEELGNSHRELENTQAALMQSERLASMGQLAAGIAHEVNNPLGIVLMYANLILEEVSEKSEMKKDLELIVEQANRCKKIVSGLLHFARQNKTLKKSTDVKVLVDNYVKFIPGNGKIKVTVNHELNDCKADIDGDQIIQVLTNLTSNAIAAMPEGGELIIKTKESGRKIIIEVEDTGTGIPLEHQGRIFDPFFTTKQIGKGTGLGLAVSYGIVKMHKGDIRFETNSDKSKGPTWTRFMVELPRKEEE